MAHTRRASPNFPGQPGGTRSPRRRAQDISPRAAGRGAWRGVAGWSGRRAERVRGPGRGVGSRESGGRAGRAGGNAGPHAAATTRDCAPNPAHLAMGTRRPAFPTRRLGRSRAAAQRASSCARRPRRPARCPAVAGEAAAGGGEGGGPALGGGARVAGARAVLAPLKAPRPGSGWTPLRPRSGTPAPPRACNTSPFPRLPADPGPRQRGDPAGRARRGSLQR